MDLAPRSLSRLRALGSKLLILPLLALSGCIGKPNQANIELRKQIQSREEQIHDLNQRHRNDQAIIRGLQQRVPTTNALPPERLAKLFTTHGLRFGRLTGGIDSDRSKPGDEGVKVYVVPTDADGQPLKAAGSFTIDLFDLDQSQSPHIGHWTFDVEQAKKNWYGAFLDYTYAFTLPWQQVPRHENLTVKVTFLDELTQLPFEAQTQIKVRLPTPENPSAPTAGTGR